MLTPWPLQKSRTLAGSSLLLTVWTSASVVLASNTQSFSPQQIGCPRRAQQAAPASAARQQLPALGSRSLSQCSLFLARP